MAKINDEWTVGPHGPLEQLDEGLLTVAGEIVMPLGRFPRRMTVAALSGGRTAIWSAIPLAEDQMARIEAMGRPALLIVPGVAHRLDIRPWKQRYPWAKVICAPGAREAVSEVIGVDAVGDVLDDEAVRLDVPPGVEGKECVLVVRRGAATSLVVNDLIANVRHPHGLGAKLMARLFGFGVDGPRVPGPVARRYVKDGKALAAAFRQWAVEPGLTRIVVSHGEVIDDNPAGALKRMAAELEG